MELTELEGVILGVVSSREPCSAHVVRQRFADSPTWGWSCSKGAIYPAVKRLVARELLVAIPSRRGKQAFEQLQLSPSGKRALASWVATLPEDAGGAPVDPLRTRVSYLAVLAPEERSALLESAVRSVRIALDAARRAQADPQSRDVWGLEAGRLGVRMQIEAKLAWLQAIRARIPTGEREAPDSGAEPAGGPAEDDDLVRQAR